MTASSASSRIGFFMLGPIASLACLFLGTSIYLKYGNPPVATKHPAALEEAWQRGRGRQ